MFEKNFAIMPLFDIYGALLSEQRRKMFELYYGDDLSLSEIAEEMNISRQGVRDSLKKCEEFLEDVDNKLGLLKKYRAAEKAISALGELNVPDGERKKLEEITNTLSSLLE